MLRPKVLFFQGKRSESSNIYSVINSDGQGSKDGFLEDFIRDSYSSGCLLIVPSSLALRTPLLNR